MVYPCRICIAYLAAGAHLSALYMNLAELLGTRIKQGLYRPATASALGSLSQESRVSLSTCSRPTASWRTQACWSRGRNGYFGLRQTTR